MIGRIINGQLIAGPVKGKAAAGNPSGHAPDDRANIGALLQVTGQITETKDHIRPDAFVIRHMQFGDDAAVSDEFQGEAMEVGEGIFLNGFPGGQCAKGMHLNLIADFH